MAASWDSNFEAKPEASPAGLQPLSVQVFLRLTEKRETAPCSRKIERFPTYAASLLGGVGERFAAFLDHLPHLADALGALGLAALVTEHVRRPAGARVDRGADFTLADAVTIADVQGNTPYRLIVILI
jgi:hypothetical protein